MFNSAHFAMFQNQRLHYLNRLLDGFVRFPHLQTKRTLHALAQKVSLLYTTECVPLSETLLAKTEITVPAYSEQRYDQPNVHKLFSSFSKLWQSGLNEYLELFCIHGSLGSGDYTDFSDCDTFLIVKKEVLSNPDLLLKLRKKLFEVRVIIKCYDPDQHHGNFLIGQPDLESYPQSVMPLRALENGWSLGGLKKIKVTICNSHEASIEKANTIASRLKCTKHIDSGMMLKSTLSYVMLLPTLILASQNQYVYKRESFILCEKKFSPAAWNVIIAATEIRQIWQPQRFWWRFVNWLYTYFPLLAMYTEGFREKCLRRLGLDRFFVKKVLQDKQNDFLDSIHFFASECLEKLIQ